MSLLDICNLIFISPLELMMKYILEQSFSRFASYGFSLIILSLFVNTLILPIYNKADSWQDEERSIKNRMHAREKMIKDSYKGQERFALISTLYRQNGYSQFYSLRSSIGFFLQIPFFIAAYHLLAFVIDFKQQGFLFIKDLSVPDALLSFGNFRINLLPILMTVINIGSALIYSKKLEKKDKIQLYGMALIFLVLLYNSPAALTFYWTLNNVYSLFKNIVEKSLLEKYRNALSFKEKISNKFESFTICSCQLFSNVLSLKLATLLVKEKSYSKIIFFFTLVIISVTYHFGKKQMFSYDGRIWILSSEFLLCVVAFISLLRCIDFSLKNKAVGVKSIIIFYVLILLIVYMLVRVAFAIADHEKHILDIKYYCYLLFLVLAIYYFPSKLIDWYQSIRLSSMLAFFSVITVFSLGLLYHPIKIYCTDPQSFSISPKEMLFVQFSVYELSILLVAIFFAVLSHKFSKFVGLFFCFLAILSMIYGFIDFHNYGAMDGFILSNAQKLYKQKDIYIDISIAFVSLFTIYYVFKKKLQRVFYIVFVLTVLSTIFVSVYTAIETLNKVQKKEVIRNVDHALYDLLSFSKTEKNIVVIMLDMFTGGNIKEINEYYPEITENLDGFVWYKDTVTAGAFTVFGKPVIIGGERLHPLYINRTSSNESLEIRVNREWGKFLRKLEDDEFSISFADDEWTDYDLIKKELLKEENIISSMSIFAPLEKKFKKDHKILNFKYESSPNATMSNIGLFKILPLSQKRKIYQDGAWGNTINYEKSDLTDEHMSFWGGILENLDLFSNTESKSNTFKYFTNMLTHVPWGLNENCLPTKDISKEKLLTMWGTGIRENKGYSKQHLISEKCALQSLIKWFNWMKKNEVYDNTQIILVSDHGRWDSSELIAAFGGDNDKKTGEVYPIALNGLLLIKDYNAKGPLRINNDLMANWDVQNLILRKLGQRTDSPWKNKDRVRCSVNGDWPRSSHDKNKYVIKNTVCIKGTIFNKNNWNIMK